MSSAVGRIYECQGHLLYFSKIWKASAAFNECMVFFAKKNSKSSPKVGNRASVTVGFYFSEGTTSKKIFAFDMTGLTPTELLKPSR